MHLTARTIAPLRLSESVADKIYFDDALRGFGFRLRRSRSGDSVLRSWVVQYRRAGGTRRITLKGVLSAEQARKEAAKILATVALGQDPQADRVERRLKDRHSLCGIVTDYLDLKAREIRPKSLREITRYLTGDYFKPLHGMPIDSVSRKDVAARLTAITLGHSSNTAGLARDALQAFFVWALQEGLVEHNPVIGTRRPQRSRGRDRVLSDAELAAVWQAAGDDDYGKIVRLLILTGARRDEIGGVRWSELDSGRGPWTLPGERAKNHTALTLPLPQAAWTIIDSLSRDTNPDHLFGTRGFTAWSRPKAELDQRLGGQVAPFQLHDLRRTAATKMADIGIQPHIIETILNHRSGHKSGIAGIYNRSRYEREVTIALAQWADHVRSLVEGGDRKVLAFSPPAAS
jgi:integrase